MKKQVKRFMAIICAIATTISSMTVFSVYATEKSENIEILDNAYGLDREAQQEYYEEFIAPKIASGELTPYRPTTSNSRSTTVIPPSCDNSTSPYFPEIGNQGNVGSCVAFATTYYQFTYEANKLKNVVTTPDNTCSPQWTYSHTNYGVNDATRLVDAYFVLNSTGCIRYEDYEEDEIVTTNDFVTHWSTNTEAAIRAMAIKGNEEELLFGKFDEEGSCTGLAITFDTNTESDHYLDGIKAGLANGEVYVFGCYFNFNEMNASSKGTHAGEKVAVRCYSLYDNKGNRVNCNHAVTIVGYDDNVCVDVNGDGEIESAEKGAFKVANSWGTDWGNDGYIWILYDALNKTTQNSDPLWDESVEGEDRDAFIYDQLVHKLNVYENTNKIFAIVNYKTDHKFNLDIYTSRSEGGSVNAEEFDYINEEGKSNVLRLLNAPFDGQIVLDHAQSPDTIEEYYTGALWSVGMYFIDEFDHDTLNSTEIRSITYVDNEMNIIKSYTGNFDDSAEYVPSGLNWCAGMYFYYFDTNIDLIIGDLNYDNIVDANDKTILQSAIVGTVKFSSLQEFLGDINGDGEINSIDSYMIGVLINNQN